MGTLLQLTCLACGKTNPPPEQTCPAGGMLLTDHYVGTANGCPHCGRTIRACEKRPCSMYRQPQ